MSSRKMSLSGWRPTWVTSGCRAGTSAPVSGPRLTTSTPVPVRELADGRPELVLSGSPDGVGGVEGDGGHRARLQWRAARRAEIRPRADCDGRSCCRTLGQGSSFAVITRGILVGAPRLLTRHWALSASGGAVVSSGSKPTSRAGQPSASLVSMHAEPTLAVRVAVQPLGRLPERRVDLDYRPGDRCVDLARPTSSTRSRRAGRPSSTDDPTVGQLDEHDVAERILGKVRDPDADLWHLRP